MNEENKYNLGPSGQLLPAEERLAVKRKKNNIIIGVPKEIAFQENRVSLAPDSVGLIVANGHEVYVERGAGAKAHFKDEEYAEAGAIICEQATEVYKSNVILKVAPMLPQEIDLLNSRQTIISALHQTMQEKEYFSKLIQHKSTTIAFEFIQDKNGIFPVLNAMSEISGYAVIQIAAEYLSQKDFGKGKLFGNIPGIAPVEVVILGAGTVALNAVKASLGFGANIKVFDNKIYKLRSLQKDTYPQLFTSIINPKVLSKALNSADVVIGALHTKNGRTPCVITEDMVKNMKSGAIIIDVSIDQGGCIETSSMTNHNDPVYIKHEVIHYCVPNIPSKVPQTASYALSNFFTSALLDAGEEGGIEQYLKTNSAMRQGIYMFNGYLTKQIIADSFNLKYKDLDLLLAAFQM